MGTDPPRGRSLMILLLCGLIPCLVLGRAGASEGPPPTLQPKSYASPSGRYALFINPSDLYGRGGASYRLTQGGREVWSGEKPFTLWEAGVTDEGVVGGYAYSHGWEGSSEAGLKAGMGDFRVVLIDPRGRLRLDRATKREPSGFLHSPPDPLAAGMMMDAANDRMVIRVRDADLNRGAEDWWIYRVSTGESLGTFRPKGLMPDPDPARFVIDARPVAGTPMFLVHWWRYGPLRRWSPLRDAVDALGLSGRWPFGPLEGRHSGARFTLISPDGKPVWSLDLPDDYDVPGDEEAEDRLRRAIRDKGAILRSDQAGRFELRFVKAARRVTFAVARGEDGKWSVSEVDRRAYAEPVAAAPPAAEIPVRPLRLVGRIDLRAPADRPAPAIRDVDHFVFDDRGRIAFLRDGSGTAPALVVADQRGKVLHAVPLDPARAENRSGWSGLTWVGGDRFLLIRDNPKDGNHMEGWWVDVATAKATPIAGFTSSALSRVAGFSDGSFVVKGGLHYFPGGATGDDSLYAFDARGQRLWTLAGHGNPKDPAALFSPEDVAFTTDGMVAVLDNIRKTVQFFDRGGKHRRTIDLKRSWGREPSYPSGIAADTGGGVVVQDFQGTPPIVRMNADGTVRAQVQPKYADGRTFRLNDARVSPDGALWVSDGHTLLRLAGSGVVDRVLGEPPDPRRLAKPTAMTLDARGRIYAVEGRTGAVHVFAPDGRRLRVCLPAPGDVAEELRMPHLTASDAGDVYLGLADAGGPHYLHFGRDGKRLGIEELKLDAVSQDWYAQPGTGRRWVLGYEKVFLVDGAGAVLRTIARRADGLWLERPDQASVAADGSIAVTSRRASLAAEGPIAVSLYSPQGEPIRAFTLPPTVAWSFPRLAFDGKLVVVAGEKEIVLFDASGKALGRFTPPNGDGDWWSPFLTPTGHELLLFNGRSTLYRFELP
jgi:sugar lactone lactonase YvrE